MKELSIEEKARRYDEAIEELRGLLEGIHEEKCEIMEEDITNIFPELKESESEDEEERIRNYILSHFQEHLNKIDEFIREGMTAPFSSEEIKMLEASVAWLEKQGEQKPNYCHHEVDLSECSEEYRKAYYDGWNNCNMQHSQCKSELDDVVKCLINGMKFYYEDNEEATWGTDKWSMPVKHIIEVLEKQNEQKPADNEMIEILRAEYEKGMADAIAKMQEWSEEDEKLTNRIEGWLDTLCDYLKDENSPECIEDVKDIMEQLKSFKERCTWKPSEEMLEALYRAIPENTMAISEDEMLLDKLYQGLKYGRVLSNK